MSQRTTSVATPVAHLVGPGKIKVINGRLAFSNGKDTPFRMDPDALENVLCYGPVGVTDDAMRMLLDHSVQVAWLTYAGCRCRGRLVGSQPSTTALRLAQYEAYSDEPVKLDLARALVLRKIESQAGAARHYQRHGQPDASEALSRINRTRQRCVRAKNLDELRGIEGAASATWFDFFGKLILPPWQFRTRVRRPPTDPVNALLSLGYTWLLTRTIARCEAAGLEVTLGSLHEFRPGRPSLACDVMEPFRVPAVDRWVVRLCNEGRVRLEDFRVVQGGFRLTQEIFPRVLADWEQFWYDTAHPAALDGAVETLVTRIQAVCKRLPTL